MSGAGVPSSASSPLSMSQRLKRRHQAWWGRKPRWSAPQTYLDKFHRLREWHTLRDRNDPDSAWRCCAMWQRTLVQKWNGREFVERHGGRVAKLYWHGSAFRRAPLEEFPADYVIRSVMGYGRRRVWVVNDGVEILRGEPAPPQEIRRRVRRHAGMAMTVPILVEEFLRGPADGHRLPPEYKCYMFADRIGAIEIVERESIAIEGMTHRCYTAAWEPIAAAMNVAVPLAPPVPPPPDLPQLVRLATALGRSIGTFMRIDFFLTDRGWVFNEFCSNPLAGEQLTPYSEELFGGLWQQICPDEL